jgi:hypothetical protein
MATKVSDMKRSTRLLLERGAEVSYCDPHFPVARPGRRNNPDLRSVPLTAEGFSRYDLLLLSTTDRRCTAELPGRLPPLVTLTKKEGRTPTGPGLLGHSS